MDCECDNLNKSPNDVTLQGKDLHCAITRNPSETSSLKHQQLMTSRSYSSLYHQRKERKKLLAYEEKPSNAVKTFFVFCHLLTLTNTQIKGCCYFFFESRLLAILYLVTVQIRQECPIDFLENRYFIPKSHLITCDILS